MSSNTPKKILLLAANPKGTTPLRLDEEVRKIDAELQRAQHREQFVLKQKWAVRLRDIQQTILDINPQIVHFSGHGMGDEDLVFEDETGIAKLVDGETLAGLLELFAEQVECVVLNGCYSSVQALALASDINYVIGISRELKQQAAIEFAVDFYNALGAGRTVEFAHKFGCAAIRLAGIPEHLTPILKKKPNIGETVAPDQPPNKKDATDVASPQSIDVFFSYSHKDEQLRDELEKHLSILKRQGVITAWYDREISAGTEWEGQIHERLNTARIILLLISADFLASNYCYDIELTRAMERHVDGEARVIPVILRPVDWQGAQFEKLQALPKNALPVTSWSNIDEAFKSVAEGIRNTVDKLTAKKVNGSLLTGTTPLMHFPQDPVMSEEKPSQSMSFSGGHFSGVQIGQAGRDLTQTQQPNKTEKQLTQAEVTELLAQIEILFRNSDLLEEQKEKALKHLETAKEETQETEPDKNFAAKSLQRAMKVLKEANETVGVGQGLYQKLEPIAKQLAPWLGIAAKSLLPL